MPLQRRLPKRGFVSLSRNDSAEVRLSALAALPVDTIDLMVLKQAGVIPAIAEKPKSFWPASSTRRSSWLASGATKGARAAIEAAGGSIEEAARPERHGRLN